jgi:hypothetical protein
MKMKKWFGFFPIILALILYACGGSGGGSGSVDNKSSGSNSGILKISVTDAPFPFQFVDSASVIIREVWVRHADGSGFE